MRLHAASGNRAEALRVFARCRELLRDELGASPSPRTEAVFLEILRDGAT
jgi:DNA-binding SARP family transcriptional activator